MDRPRNEAPSGEVNATSRAQMSWKRPIGLTLTAVSWGLAAIYDLVVSFTMYGPYDAVAQYGDYFPRAPWFHTAVGTDWSIRILIQVFSLLQVFTVYGMLKGNSWSYYAGLVLPILVLLLFGSTALLYFAAPERLGLRTPTLLASLGLAAVWVGVMWVYLTRSHVQDYLSRW
ncbi:MAG: hypothetical protein HY297_05950 [Thaumarchaeota archaeon]|nr:hypothetical protein [Nitrososphaerota archaeon]